MRHHVGDRAADMFVGRGVEHLLALPLRSQDAGRPQQAQMVADQRGREPSPRRDVRNASRAVEAGENDPEPARVAHEPEHLREFDRLIISN